MLEAYVEHFGNPLVLLRWLELLLLGLLLVVLQGVPLVLLLLVCLHPVWLSRLVLSSALIAARVLLRVVRVVVLLVRLERATGVGFTALLSASRLRSHPL